MPHETVAQVVDVLLEVLGALGVPGTPLARRAVQAVEGLRRSREARQRLEKCLQQAEEEFIRGAREKGLDAAAQWVVMLPQQNRPLFRQALESLLKRWDEEDLQRLLEREFSTVPGLEKGKQRCALTLYLTILHAHLVQEEAFRQVIIGLSVLRTEGKVDALYEAITALRGLPRGLVTWPVIPPPQEGGLRAYLLQPKYRLVPYTGRHYRETLGDLMEWARGLEAREGRVGLRIYQAAGGGGKTRLLIEAGQALREEGWWVGFLSGPLEIRDAERLVSDPRHTLLIVDYVAGRPQEVLTLLRALVPVATAHLSPNDDVLPRSAPLALVFLEREMPGWLAETLRTGEGLDHPHRWEFLALPGVEREAWPLPEVAPEERETFFHRAVETFSRRIGAVASPVSYCLQDLPERPLPLVLLALHAAAGERVPDPKDEEAILGFTWQREQVAWKRLLHPPLEKHGVTWAEEEALKVVEQVLLLATLGRPFPNVEALAAFLQAHFPPICSATGQTLDWGWLAERFREIFPEWKEGALPPITPDPLADFVLLRRLAERPDLVSLALPGPEEAEARPEEALRAAGQALGVLARLWERAADELERERVAGWMRAAAEHLAAWPSSDWNFLDSALPAPDRTLALRPFLADFYRARLERTPPEATEERAQMLVMLGWALSALGRREAALAATEEAVAIRRQLAQANPQAFLPNLAMSLNNLGTMLSNLGRREEALAATEEAVGHYRELAQANPQAFLPDLARSLGVHGFVLLGLERPAEAAEVLAEGARLLLPFARALPQAFSGLLQALLGDYLRACQASGQPPDEALLREAGGIWTARHRNSAERG